MPAKHAQQKPALAGAERAARKASIFLAEQNGFRLGTATFGHPLRRKHWIEHLTTSLEKEGIHLTHCHIPESGEPRLLDEITSHLRDSPTRAGHRRAVVVTGFSNHLPTADVVIDQNTPRPRILAQANLDREDFPARCPHPLLLCLTPTSLMQFRRLAPDLAHWSSHNFDFTEPALPDGTHPIRGISELQTTGAGTTYANRDEALRAAGIFSNGLAAALAAHGPDHLKTVEVRDKLANTLQQLGRGQEALEHLLENLRVLEKTNDFPEGKTAEFLSNIALQLMRMNHLGEAEPLMRRALFIAEFCHGKNHPKVVTYLNNLAQLLQDTNRLGEAEPLMRRALLIDEISYGKDHPNVARNLGNLATLLKATNRLSEAEPLMRRALLIDETSFGKDHPNVARDLNNLAQLLQDTNRLGEAEPLMRRALLIDETCYGKNHLKVATRLNNIAVLLQNTNRLDEAEALMRRALLIDETCYGKDHPDVAIHLNNLAQLLQDTNRLGEAEPLMRQVVLILLRFTAATGHEHPHLCAVIGNYALLCSEMQVPPEEIVSRLEGLFDEAGVERERMEKILDAIFGNGA